MGSWAALAAKWNEYRMKEDLWQPKSSTRDRYERLRVDSLDLKSCNPVPNSEEEHQPAKGDTESSH